MFRYLAIFFLVYLVYKLIKLFVYSMITRKQSPPDISQGSSEAKKKHKIITKDEGEYVDFEELKND